MDAEYRMFFKCNYCRKVYPKMKLTEKIRNNYRFMDCPNCKQPNPLAWQVDFTPS